MSQWCGDRGSDEQLSVGFEQIGGLLCFRQSEDDIVSPIAAVEGGAWIQEAEMSKGVNACDAFVGGCPEVAFVIEGDLSHGIGAQAMGGYGKVVVGEVPVGDFHQPEAIVLTTHENT